MVEVLYEGAGLLLMFFVLGIIWASIDKSVGVWIRRTWHRMTSKKGLPEHDKRGFIVGQSTPRKLTAAGIISLIQSLYVYFRAEDANFMTEFLLFFLETGVMFLGFHASRWVGKVGSFFMSKIAPKLDKLEDEEFNSKPKDTATTKKAEVIEDKTSDLPAPMAEPVAVQATPEPVAPAPIEEKNPRDVLKGFGRRP